MLTIYIYKDNRKIEEKSFEDELYIMQNDDGFWWETSAEQEERATARGERLKELVRKFKGGTIVIWIRVRPAPYPADIKSVGPDWRVTIDGTVMDSGIHSNLYVSGKTIELEHGVYRFVCSFPPSKCGPKSLPQQYDFTPIRDFQENKTAKIEDFFLRFKRLLDGFKFWKPLNQPFSFLSGCDLRQKNDNIRDNCRLSIMHIFHSNRKFISTEFKNNFLIRRVIDTDELYWIVDNEQPPNKGPSGLQIWIRGASVGGEIDFVPPYWQLIIDGVNMEPGFYDQTIDVGGRDIELQYRDYRFVCSFPANKDRPPTKIEDLKPSVPANTV